MAEVNGNFPPLMLALGYTQGVQVWSIPMTGEAQEVLAWRQGQVKTLKVCFHLFCPLESAIMKLLAIISEILIPERYHLIYEQFYLRSKVW